MALTPLEDSPELDSPPREYRRATYSAPPSPLTPTAHSPSPPPGTSPVAVTRDSFPSSSSSWSTAAATVPRSPTNPWAKVVKSVTNPVQPQESDVQIEDCSFPSDRPASPSTSPSTSTSAPSDPDHNPPRVPSAAPRKVRPASAHPDCGNDGRWTTPRLLARDGQGGSRAGIWPWQAYDVEVEDTPSNSKYPPMGDWKTLPEPAVELGDGAVEATNEERHEAQENDTTTRDDVETIPSGVKPPKRGFQTVRHSELETIRPHPDLFFCCETLSWGLFTKLPSVSTDFAAEGVPLWRFDQMDNYRQYLPPHESVNAALYDDVKPPFPYPLSPHDPESLRTVPHHIFPPRQHASLCSLKLSFAASTQRHRVLFSTQQFYPSVLGQELWKNLLETRGQNPQPGQTAEQAKVTAVNFVWRALDDALFKGETRALPIEGKTFKRSMPWDDISCDVFLSILGYSLVADGDAIQPPGIDERSLDGAANRKRLLRAWLELGIWLQDRYTRANDVIAKRETRIKLRPAQIRMTEIAGGDDLSKIDPSQVWTQVNSSSRPNSDTSKNPAIDPLAAQYSMLGCTPDLSDESLLSVFDTQMRTWSGNSPEFLEALLKISTVRSSERLSTKIVLERSKGKYPRSEINQAYAELRLPVSDDNDLIGEDDLSQAFDKRLTEVEHPERRKVLKEALNVIAQHKQSEVLQAVLISLSESEGSGPGGMQGVESEKMDLDRAYRALEIDKGADDEMIAMVYEVRVSDAKDDAKKKKMRTAVEVIAEDRNSVRLKAITQTNETLDAPSENWQLVPTADRNVPVGLTNIANTCYLNSLLQYFFTVRELRQAVLAFSVAEPSDRSTTNQIRVGGRLVSQAEIQRSRQFVLLLQTLFQQLTYSNSAAITPETELAYLALVPGKEEAGTESSKEKPALDSTHADKDADLIILESPENVVTTDTRPLIGSKSPSVLGKRRTDEKDEDVPMLSETTIASSTDPSLEPPETVNPVASDADMAEASPLPTLSRSSSSTAASFDARNAKRGRSVDQLPLDTLPTVEIPDGALEPAHASPQSMSAPALSTVPAPPPLPPRPPLRQQTKDEKLEAQVSDYMAFGRQNDVTECMDNVMFQIEAALQSSCDQGAESLLKRIFYGKNRQKLVFEATATTSEEARTQEEPFFSLLVDVPPASFDRDIYDGLDAVFDDAPVEIEGRSAQRSISLLELPPILQIQLQRVQYDREKGRIFKSNAHLKFPEELNVGRYLEIDGSDRAGWEKKARTNALRSNLGRTRAKLARLEQNTSQAQHFKDALDHLGANSDELGHLLSPTLSEDTAIEVQDLENETTTLRKRTKELREAMLEVWGANREHDYELRAVFIHRGTASSGHYYIYQRDSRDPQRWLKYNDSLVSSADRDEIFRETMSDTNAYFLVYCRKDCLDAIETVERDLN